MARTQMIPIGAAADARATHAADRGSCFLKNGDRWLFVGDSITATDTYRKLLLRVLQHYHPEADILVGNSAVAGVASDYKEERAFTPTVVTIMLGMNDVIHQDWPFTPDVSAKAANYRKYITERVRQYRGLGAEVILLTPTYTDERFPAVFNVAMTRRFLEAFGAVVREVAAAEQCHWVPVAEELEAYQDTLAVDQTVRWDGVHPQGLGQYQIARTLWQHLNIPGRLDGLRRIQAVAEPLAMEARLARRFMHAPADGVTLLLATKAPAEVTATWSAGAARSSVKLALGPTETAWPIPVPSAELDLPLNSWRQVVVEFDDGMGQRLCVVDLARTGVLHLDGGVVSGEIISEEDRPEGRRVGTWKVQDAGDELWFSGDVIDSEIAWTSPPPHWPTARDGVHLWLDLRPAARFADINVDRDVSGLLITVRDQPHFCVTPVSWVNTRLMYAVVAGGEKTSTGYRWHCGIGGQLSDARPLGVRALDYFGFRLIVIDNDQTPTPVLRCYPAWKGTATDPLSRLSLLTIVDRRGMFPGDETTNLHLFH